MSTYGRLGLGLTMSGFSVCVCLLFGSLSGPFALDPWAMVVGGGALVIGILLIVRDVIVEHVPLSALTTPDAFGGAAPILGQALVTGASAFLSAVLLIMARLDYYDSLWVYLLVALFIYTLGWVLLLWPVRRSRRT